MTYKERHYKYPGSYREKIIPYGKLDSKGLKFERAVHVIGGSALALCLVGGAVLGVGSGARAMAGSYGKQFPEAEAQKLNTKKYDSAFQATNPAGKFVMQYLRRINIDHVEYPDAHGMSSGTVEADGWGDGAFWQTTVGNACLSDTAYDIAGGSINANLTYSGLFSYVGVSVHGNIPTAAAFAEVDPNNSNELIVQSGNNKSVTLSFTGLENKDTHALVPANEQTVNILDTYGCSIRPTTSQIINSGQYN